MSFSLKTYDITTKEILRNATPAELYEDAIRFDGSIITKRRVAKKAPMGTSLDAAG